MFDKVINAIKGLGSLFNVGEKTKTSLAAIKEDFTNSFAYRKPDLDIDYDPRTGKVVVELNHHGLEAKLPFGMYLVDGAHRAGIGVLEGNAQTEVLHTPPDSGNVLNP